MWLKLILLCLYLLLLFVLSRLLEVTSWCNGTTSFLNSRVLLDPFSLSVKKLKQLLDNRGVSYSGAIEKQDLIKLVEVSGSVAEDELLEDGESTTVLNHQTTHFTCGSHFYEEVEDTKDSIWLVQVATEEENNKEKKFLENTTWNEVMSKVAKFGVRTGIFYCSTDKRLCSRKKWTSPRLILALPRGHAAKEDVELHNYLHSIQSLPILNWVRSHLTSRIKEFTSKSQLTKWIEKAKISKTSQIQMILFSELGVPPLFLSSLAIKFTGRVKFAMVSINKKNKNSFKEFLKGSNFPLYLVITPERNYYYGTRIGENLTFKDVELFLKSLHPEMNDVFVWSLLLVNCLAGFEWFLVYRQIWKHLIRCFVIFFKYNCILLLGWLLLLTMYQFLFMTVITELSLKYTRIISGTNISAILRYDWKIYCSWYFMLSVYLSLGIVAGFVLRKYGRTPTDDEIAVFSNSWEIPLTSFVLSYFFRPITNRSMMTTPQEVALEEGMELLIERLAVPNLWLQPMISTDYIKDLPIWKYQGWCDADDVLSDNKLDSSSEDESSSNVFQLYQNPKNQTPILPESSVCNNPPFKLKDGGLSSQKCHCEVSRANSKKLVDCDSTVCSCSSYKTLIDKSPFSSSTFCTEKSEIQSAERAPSGMLEFRECSICLEAYQYTEMLCGVPCGHNFHMNCIMLWLYRDNHCCPVCRWPTYKSKSKNVHLHSQ